MRTKADDEMVGYHSAYGPLSGDRIVLRIRFFPCVWVGLDLVSDRHGAYSHYRADHWLVWVFLNNDPSTLSGTTQTNQGF